MLKNSERFITAFNRIDKALDSELNQSRGIGFSKAVRILAKYNAVVNRYKEDLLEYAELRNAIVHNRMDTIHVIAEPHDSVVAHMEKIEQAITEPKRVIPMFSKEVYSFASKDTLSDLLDVIYREGYSKFPVYNHDVFIGLVTESGITKWLAEHKQTSISEVTIEEIIPYQKESNYQFVAKTTTVYQVVDLFKEHISKGNRLDALLISETGEKQEPLLGIITAWDIMGIE
ncbi:CBS domain-containing protein [Ornithinibacillus contaminans]|uniref:CBS domain-containing protein n=1 Tax=Ornithinibacillus contaminans TaxID=694055 RepID=UPI00064DCB23|nr:CBS domain-containing protein [Ornithinibacillus contaminans]